MAHILRAALLGATTVLASCGTLGPATSIGNSIVDDTLTLNEAYGAASNAVILKNILRARDRWPTTYTTLSEIESSPSLVRSGDISLSPLGLGNAAGPFKGSGSKFSNASKAGNSYTVAPFVKDIMSPMDKLTFAQYFDRWPRDVAVLMLVNGLKVKDGERTRLLRHDGEDIDGFIMELARGFRLSETQYHAFNIGKDLDLDELDSGEYGLALRQSERLGLSEQQLSIRQEFELRSIDSIIYYLGETLRNPQTPITVTCDVRTEHGYQEIKVKAPILNVVPAQEAMPVRYAIQVKHAGQTYLALPNATQVEAKGGCLRERSSTAIAMLTQLLMLSQDPEAFNGPQTLSLR